MIIIHWDELRLKKTNKVNPHLIQLDSNRGHGTALYVKLFIVGMTTLVLGMQLMRECLILGNYKRSFPDRCQRWFYFLFHYMGRVCQTYTMIKSK